MIATLPEIQRRNGQQVVSARDLWEYLECRKDFSDWIKHRIRKYGLIENHDYVVFPHLGENLTGGRPTTEYALTIDAAKELAMVEGNAKGKQARQYFIECERQIKEAEAPKTEDQLLAQAMNILNRRLEQHQIELEQANKTIQSQAPKVQYANEVLSAENCHVTTTIAKELGMSAAVLNQKLREVGIQYFIDGHWVLYAKYQDKGYTKTRTHTYHDSEGKQKTSIQMVWTERGRAFIHQVISQLAAGTQNRVRQS